MSWIHYIDNEVPWDAPAHYGEWDSLSQAGGSTVVQSTDAAFPERGAYGLRCQTVAGNNAYVQKDDIASIAPGGELYVGFWMNVAGLPAVSSTYLSSLYNGGSMQIGVYFSTAGSLKLACRRDGGWTYLGWIAPPAATGRWLYFVLAVKRASSGVAADGWFRMWFDGRLAAEGINQDNYDTFAGSLDLRAGCHASARDNLDVYLDEYKVATSYPEPYVPTPADEYPSADRTIVLYRTASADSVAFADYCVAELGIPLANLIPLPNATANEGLADYATFQTEVETDLAAYLALNPTVAANCSCFLIGYGVPGYFTVSAVVHSAVSRLMNYGTAFSSGTANPLYNPSTVARLTKTALGGKYLCSRIDADTLQHARDLIDRAATVSALAALPDSDTLWSGDATYRASLACQKLRLLIERYVGGEGIEADDAAFIWFTEGGSYGTGGSKVACVDVNAASGYSLRTGSTTCIVALHTQGFAAALGNSHTADTFDAESFFEMLRIGGTLAEASIVAVRKLDFTAVGAGSPLLTVAFQLGGYNVYRGLGGIESIDWQGPVACARSGEAALSVYGELTPGLRYVFAARAVSAEGVEEGNTHVVAYAELDEQGGLLPAPLARPIEQTAEAQPDGTLLVGFSYAPPVGFAEADGFDLLGNGGTGEPDLESPLATVDGAADGQTDFEVSISRPEVPTLLACRARSGEQLGPVGEALCVPAPDAPSPAELL